MNYLWFKAFHIVGIVAWFAGMFYLPRLFVYHAEANEQPEPARTILQQQYQMQVVLVKSQRCHLTHQKIFALKLIR